MFSPLSSSYEEWRIIMIVDQGDRRCSHFDQVPQNLSGDVRFRTVSGAYLRGVYTRSPNVHLCRLMSPWFPLMILREPYPLRMSLLPGEVLP